MKPRSIISLIVAAVLVLAGIITCVIASAKADADGVMLFPEGNADGDLVYKMELDGISKVTVDAADADITVIGGAESSSIEVVNFNANYYKLTENGGSLNFAQVDDFLSMFKFWDNGFSFKGMRYILRFGDDAAGNKQVIIRLADSDDIRLVNLSTNTGTVSLENCSFGADYTVKAENGKAVLNGVTNAASLSIHGNSADVSITDSVTDKLAVNGNALSTSLYSVTAKESTVKVTDGNVDIKSSAADTLSVSTVKGNVTLSPCSFKDGSISTDSGKVTLSLDSTDNIAATVATKNGRVSVNGTFTDSFTLSNISPEYKLSVSTSGGDVYITHP